MAQSRELGDGGQMNIRTSRIGILTIHASAPVIGGRLSDAELEFWVRIDQVTTGNPLLDPELHALIHEITSGTLKYSGTRSGDTFTGRATAGNVEVPLELVQTTTRDGAVEVTGTSRFSDVHVPLPGLGHIKHLDVDIEGRLHLA